jgi:hypothetical protein
MSARGFLLRLAGRAVDPAGVIQPRLASRFEPAPSFEAERLPGPGPGVDAIVAARPAPAPPKLRTGLGPGRTARSAGPPAAAPPGVGRLAEAEASAADSPAGTVGAKGATQPDPAGHAGTPAASRPGAAASATTGRAGTRQRVGGRGAGEATAPGDNPSVAASPRSATPGGQSRQAAGHRPRQRRPAVAARAAATPIAASEPTGEPEPGTAARALIRRRTAGPAATPSAGGAGPAHDAQPALAGPVAGMDSVAASVVTEAEGEGAWGWGPLAVGGGGEPVAGVHMAGQPLGEPPPPVVVTIGRIEVRAGPPPAASPPPKPSAAPAMSLDEYLRRRERGGGR